LLSQDGHLERVAAMHEEQRAAVGISVEREIRKRLTAPGYKRWGLAVWGLILSDRYRTTADLHRAVAELTRRDLAWASRFTENVFHQVVLAVRERLFDALPLQHRERKSASTDLSQGGGPADGRIPGELRAWVGEQFPADDVLRSLNEVNAQECLELSEFLDLNDLERAVASEQAQRQR
jgi:hypothetical protein